MSQSDAVLMIVIGCAAEAVAIWNKQFEWGSPGMTGHKQAPRWLGRLMFGTIGALFILLGIRYFLLGY